MNISCWRVEKKRREVLSRDAHQILSDSETVSLVLYTPSDSIQYAEDEKGRTPDTIYQGHNIRIYPLQIDQLSINHRSTQLKGPPLIREAIVARKERKRNDPQPERRSFGQIVFTLCISSSERIKILVQIRKLTAIFLCAAFARRWSFCELHRHLVAKSLNAKSSN